MSRLVKILIFTFLAFNLIVRISFLENELIGIKLIFFLGILFCFFIFLSPRYLKILLFLFAFSFPLYGWDSFSIYNLTFEFIVVISALTLYFIELKEDSDAKINSTLFRLFLLYISLSCLSLVLFPIRHAWKLISLWGLKEFSNAFVASPPDFYLYSFAAINRLLLFFIFIYLLSIKRNSRSYYHVLFAGALAGAVGAAIFGILNQSGVISLDWYQSWSFENRLQSVFGNPSWFSEFICIVSPFILLGFLRKTKGWAWKFFLFLILMICLIAVILTGSRTSWLIYMLMLFLIFYFLFLDYDGKEKSLKRKNKIIIKVFVSITIFVLISLFIILQIIEKPKPPTSSAKDTQYIKLLDEDYHVFLNKRLSSWSSLKIRQKLWEGGIALGLEKPIFGMGYESYGWHAKILANIKESQFYKNDLGQFINTPHNTFIQIFVSGGIIGIMLWFSIISYILWILILRLKKEMNLINLSVVLSIIIFYLYGLVQSMQYIPVIWFFNFLCIGYGMTADNSALTPKQHKFWQVLVNIFVIGVIIGGFIYLFNPESKNLAKKYGLKIYANDISINQYQGFYPLERGSSGSFRWSGKKALIKYDGKGTIELKYQCHHPDVEKNPVVVSVYLHKEKIDLITFTGIGEKKRQYYFSNSENEPLDILFEVSRIWNPRKYGINVDNRNLGIGISPIKTVRGFPQDDVGFYPFENWEMESNYWPNEKSVKFRWMGTRTTIKVKENDKRKGIKLYFLASHPDLSDEKPVLLRIYGDSKKISELELKKFWQEVKIDPRDIEKTEILTFRVSRTWNPKLLKMSLDNRDLGAAVIKRN